MLPRTRSEDSFSARLQRHWPLLRWLPWASAALLSITVSFLAPDGRKPFDIDWRITQAAWEFSIFKGPHIGVSAMLALLAVIGTGRHRLGLAFAITVLVGAGWELGQTTVIGHQARLTDLAPDAIGAFFGCLWGAGILWLLEAERRANGPAFRQTIAG
ncbi:hypothetical protein BH11PSE9_BH11PSE9_12830 [soil metagenome]